MKKVLIFGLGVTIGAIAMLVLSRSNLNVEKDSLNSSKPVMDVGKNAAKIRDSNFITTKKAAVYHSEIQEKNDRIEELERLLESQKEDHEKRLKGVSFMADIIPVGNSNSNTTAIWEKMDEIANTDYKAEKDEWSYRAEQFLTLYLSQNSFIHHTNVDFFCDMEACLVTALEFDVGENFHTSEGSKEWVNFWQKTEDDKSVEEFFLKEKMGGSNPGEKDRTREKRMIFMRR